MDIIGIKFSVLFAIYGAVILVSISFQYFCLKGRAEFIVAYLGLLGIFLFGLVSTLFSFQEMTWAQTASHGALALLMGSLFALFLFNFSGKRKNKKFYLFAQPLVVLCMLAVGESFAPLSFLIPTLPTVFLAFKTRGQFRLPSRYYFFFVLFFTIGLCCFLFPARSFIIDLFEGLFILLSFIFAYQAIMVFMATSFIDFRLGVRN